MEETCHFQTMPHILGTATRGHFSLSKDLLLKCEIGRNWLSRQNEGERIGQAVLTQPSIKNYVVKLSAAELVTSFSGKSLPQLYRARPVSFPEKNPNRWDLSFQTRVTLLRLVGYGVLVVGC